MTVTLSDAGTIIVGQAAIRRRYGQAHHVRTVPTAAPEIIGGKWQFIVLYALAQGPRRFNELQRLTPGVSHKVLTQTVRHLEIQGLIERDVGVGVGAVPCVI